MTDPAKKKIEKTTLIGNNRIAVFMKGTPDFPQCGFSARTVQCLEAVGAEFNTLNVLEDMDVREGVKEFSSWPTIPQVYFDGEFIGGCDIIYDMYNSGELEKRVQSLKGGGAEQAAVAE